MIGKVNMDIIGFKSFKADKMSSKKAAVVTLRPFLANSYILKDFADIDDQVIIQGDF